MTDTVFQVTGRIVTKLIQTRKIGSGKAVLARLRQSIGKNFAQTVEIWPEVFAELPEIFLSQTGEPTEAEKAIITSLQFYALHQQGNEASVNSLDSKNTIGQALQTLRQDKGETGIGFLMELEPDDIKSIELLGEREKTDDWSDF